MPAYKYEHIVNRKKESVAAEILVKNAQDYDWCAMDVDDLSRLVIAQLNDALTNCKKLKFSNVSVNIECSQLYNHTFCETLVPLVNKLKDNHIGVVFEITERCFLNKNFLIEDGFLGSIKQKYNFNFAADDVNLIGWLTKNEELEPRYQDINNGIYDVIKIDQFPKWFYEECSDFIEKELHAAYEQMTFLINHFNVHFLAEKIENERQWFNANRLPFDFFQGYFFSPQMQ